MRRSRVLAALLILPGCEGLFDPSEGDCKGNYTYEQVALWDQKVHYLHMNVAGIISYDFDERQVCLAFGVEKWSVAKAIEARLRELEIPRDAVYIEVTVRPQLAYGAVAPIAQSQRGARRVGD